MTSSYSKNYAPNTLEIDAPQKSGHLTEIDYLRGIAILLTLVAHFSFMQSTPSPIYTFVVSNIAQFWGGVILFFTISGFVISRSFMNDFTYLNAPSRQDFKEICKLFYLRRFYRIVPTAVFWIFITVILALEYNQHGSFGEIRSVFVQTIAAILFIYNALTPWIAGPALGIYWSLSFEEQFYLIFPLLSRLNTQLKFLILLIVIGFFFFIHRPADQSRLITSFPLDAICYGVLISLIQQNRLAQIIKPTFLSQKKYGHLNLLVTVSIMIFSPILLKNITCGTSILVLSGAWLVFCASYDCDYIKPSRYIADKLRTLGKASFSLYCCHMPCYLITKEISVHYKQLYNISLVISNIISLVIASFLCLIFTYLSLRLIEKPTRKYARMKCKIFRERYTQEELMSDIATCPEG